jgi:hypothetical protein
VKTSSYTGNMEFGVVVVVVVVVAWGGEMELDHECVQ